MFGKKKTEEVQKEKKETTSKDASDKKNSGIISVISISIMSIIFIAVALVMLFVKDATVEYILYAICGTAIAAGIFAIVRYFVRKAYCDLNEYGFAEGVLLVTLGICGLVKVESLAPLFLTVVGIALLISGVVKLQSALGLRMMNDAIWFLVLIISVIVIGFSVFVLLKPDMNQTYTWYVLLADGILGLVNVIYQDFRIKAYNSAEVRAKEKEESELRDKIIKEQEDARIAREEQQRTELENKAAEDKALAEKLKNDDARYGFNENNSVPNGDSDDVMSQTDSQVQEQITPASGDEKDDSFKKAEGIETGGGSKSMDGDKD